MEDIHVHAENRLYKVYGRGPASFMDTVYAHMRGLGTLWLLSIIPFIIVYINTFNVQYGLTVSFFIVLIELGKHLSFYEGPPRAFLVLDYYPSDESGYEARANHCTSEDNECNESSEDEGEETTIETSCETDGIVDESPCETDGAVSDHPCEGEGDLEETEDLSGDETEDRQCCSEDQETSNLESPSESSNSTEKNETTEETPCEPVESTKED